MRRIALALIVLFVGLGPALSQSSDPAAQQISRFYDALLASMKGGKSLGVQGRYRKLEPVITQVFDLPDMTKYAVGPAWDKMSAADQQALIRAFTRMTVADYAKNFDSYDGEQFTVDPNVQTRGQDKLVSTKLITASKSVTPFIYRMREAGGTWKVVDVFLNGFVSELATKRSDFASTVASGGASALVAKINSLADNLLKEG
ncbi:MAG TPA: ABC transporter substrate-binding protein [Rhizomicrobium sp.]|jgi:phospholipid transport system substrate-binding protein